MNSTAVSNEQLFEFIKQFRDEMYEFKSQTNERFNKNDQSFEFIKQFRDEMYAFRDEMYELKSQTNKRFNKVDERLDFVSQRVTSLEKSHYRMEDKLAHIETMQDHDRKMLLEIVESRNTVKLTFSAAFLAMTSFISTVMGALAGIFGAKITLR